MRWLAVLVLWLLTSPLLPAQVPARGLAVKVEFALEPTAITLGEDVTLTLTIRNAFNPQRLSRPDLRKLPEFDTRFVITDVPGDTPKPNAPAVKFVYRLRPRESGTITVPRLAYTYFTPQDRPNTTLTQKGLAIEVTAPVVPPAVIVPVQGPAELFQIASLEELATPATGRRWFLLLIPLGPLLAMLWFLAWRRIYPDAARVRRHRAARRALRAIDAAPRSPDPARALAAAVLTYLHERRDLPASATTPDEVEAAMLGDHDLLGETLGILRRCDAVRFSHVEDESLATDARRLIASWEAA